MADDPWASGIVPSSTQAVGPPADPWANGIVAPAPEIDPKPPAYSQRVMEGEHLEQFMAKSYPRRLAEWTKGQLDEGNYGATALGTAATFAAGMVEFPFDFLKQGMDFIKDKVYAEPPKTISDSDQPSDTLDREISIGVNASMLVGGGGTNFGRSISPLLVSKDGTAARIVADAEGNKQIKPIGKFPPNQQDFANAAQNIGDGIDHDAMGPVEFEEQRIAEAQANDQFSPGEPLPPDVAAAMQRRPLSAKTEEELAGKLQLVIGLPKPANRADIGIIQKNLIDQWHEEGLHPAELAGDAEHDAFLRHDLSSAAAQPSDIPPLVSPDVQPLAPAGKIASLARNAVEKANDLSRDVKMLVSPMTAGTKDTMAIVKDFANAKRRNAWEWARSDQDLVDKFTPAEREEMWNKADEESVLQQEGKFNENMGAATMRPDMEAKVDELQQPSRIALGKAQELGIIKGEGLPYYTPRMIVDMLENFNSGKPVALGAKSGVRTSTPGAFARKHLTAEETEAAAKGAVAPGAQIVRDIRTLPLATYRLEEANAGRALINQIKEYGEATGKPTVVNGELPAGADPKDWFTVEHPSFRTWEPMYERDAEGRPILEGNALKIAKNENGDMLYQSVPLHVSRDFEGPLKSVLTEKNSKVYNGMMALKGKTMSLVMNSPMIHNIVEWSRALPAMPGKVLTLRAYFEGNAAKNNPDVMREFLDNGLVPIGKRFFNQDISGILESPDLTPGRSWTAKIAAFVPGLFDEAAGTAVKQAIDKAGDFWHNTLLWDRVADLQMGLATNFQKDAIAAGMDRVTATRYAAHFANRFAGSLPQEAMSQGARKIANLALFSRTYTLGNLGVMKDMFTGMPQDVLAQIERDAGPEALAQVKSKARRMAISTVAFDAALTIIGGSILQNTFNVMANDSSLEQELHGYVRRMQGMMNDAKEHPLSLLLPWNLINEAKKISSQSDNEPGKQDRIHIGNMADGTGIYGTNPTGRMGNEFMDYMTGPLDQMRRKMGTYAKPALSILANQQYFGEAKSPPIYDANASDIQNGLNIGKTVLRAQAPAGQMDAFGRLVTGDKNTGFDALQLLGPVIGTSVSKGAPGGPVVGEYYHDKQMQEYQVQTQMKDIRDLIDKGKEDEARDRMTALGMPRLYQNWVVRTTENPSMRFNPRVTNQLYNALTPAQRERMERLRGY